MSFKTGIEVSLLVKSNGYEGVTSTWTIDSEEEFNEIWSELHSNSDFTYLGQFDMTQDIDDELLYQGFSLQEIAQLTINHYGHVLEVIEYEDVYHAFIGIN